MQIRRLGTAGPDVSRLALGAMTFGRETTEDEARRILDAFVEDGGTLIDTADTYNGGESERIIGRWLGDRPGVRDRIVLATKGRFPVAGAPAGLSPDYLRSALDASLKRLGVDHVDLYQTHGPDSRNPFENVTGFFAEAAAAGKTRYAGVSNLAGWQIAKLARLSSERSAPPITSHQPQYNLLAREVEWEVFPAAIDAGVGAIVWGPMAAGWLTGKYDREAGPRAGTRVGENPENGLEAWQRRGTDRNWEILRHLRSVAADHGISATQAALAWVADRPGVTAPIVGVRTLDQLRDVLGAADLRLDPAARNELDEATQPPTPDYPYTLLAEIAEN